MLKAKDAPLQVYDQPSEADNANLLDLGALLRTILRRWRTVAACIALMTVLAAIYVLTATSRYTASASVLIDSRKNNLMQNQQVVGEQVVDTGLVDSQAEILRSDSVALQVIRDLKLVEDKEFYDTSGSALGNAIGSVRALFADPAPPNPARIERSILDKLQRGLVIKRIGLTYVIQIDFTSQSPAKSAKIANAVADAYMFGELESKYQATRRASKWLQDRIKELRDQATTADRTVQDYKAANNIVDTSRGLMGEQQLSDVNGQLVQARAATAESKARLDRVNEIARQELPDATVADALRNDVITRLRAQYLDLSARAADWSNRFGANHAATVNLRNQMREIKRSINDEIRRIAETYKSDYQISRARELSLQQSMAKLVTEAGTTSQAQVQLRDLESSAQTYRSLYDTFLQKFTEATQQQSFQVNEARIITAATDPAYRSSPRASLALGGGALLGLFLGIGVALTRELLDNAFRSAADVERTLNLDCLGILPAVEPTAVRASDLSLPAPRGGGTADLAVVPGPARYVLEAPFSRFTETLRHVKVSIDLARLTRETNVIGIVSSLPREGKTTISANLAQLAAQTGNRVLLIDCDLRNPTLTRLLAPRAEEGLIEALGKKRPLEELVKHDPATGLHFLPTALKGRISHTSELVSSDAMADLLTRARDSYDYVFVDFAPIMAVVDVKAASHLVDAFVVVIEWGKTSRTVAKEALSIAEVVRERTLGVVLNNADTAELRKLESYRGRHYHDYYTDGHAPA